MSQFSYVAATTANATAVRAVPAVLKAYDIVNTSAATKFVRFYNKATAPVPASDAALIVWRLPIPAGGRTSTSFSSGGVWFPAGLAFDITTAAADTDTTVTAAGDVTLNIIFD